MDDSDLFGDAIHQYGRAQAMADGTLVDLSTLAPDVCRQHFRYPIAMTSAAFAPIERALQCEGCDLKGIIHDILWMARVSGRAVDSSTRIFDVLIGGHQETLKIVCGPGDDPSPVLTVMLTHED